MNSGLTSVGQRQALANGKKLKKLVPQDCRIISSPLGRCRETSEIVATALEHAHTDIEYDSRLKETSFGSWEGRTLPDVQLEEPDIYQRRRANRWDIPPPGGESYAMVAKRLQSWMAELGGPQTLIVVSHGCAGRILRGIFADMAPSSIYDLDEPHEAIYKLERGEVSRVD